MHPPQRSSLFVPILPVPETEAETEGQSSEGPPLMSLCPNPHFTEAHHPSRMEAGSHHSPQSSLEQLTSPGTEEVPKLIHGLKVCPLVFEWPGKWVALYSWGSSNASRGWEKCSEGPRPTGPPA